MAGGFNLHPHIYQFGMQLGIYGIRWRKPGAKHFFVFLCSGKSRIKTRNIEKQLPKWQLRLGLGLTRGFDITFMENERLLIYYWCTKKIIGYDFSHYSKLNQLTMPSTNIIHQASTLLIWFLVSIFFSSPVVIMCASPSTIREIMLAAAELNMVDSGEYVFFNIDIFSR